MDSFPVACIPLPAMPAKKDAKKDAKKAEPKTRAIYCANPVCFTALRRLPLKPGSPHTVTFKAGKKTYQFCSQFCREQAGKNLEKIAELDKIAAEKRQKEAPAPEPEAEEKDKDKKAAGDEEEGEAPAKGKKPASDDEE